MNYKFFSKENITITGSVFLLTLLAAFNSCDQQHLKNEFEVSGHIKNIPDQKIFLEEIYFSKKDPEILDTGEIKNGDFSLSAVAPEEGLYRLRMDKGGGFIFINDQPKINFNADFRDVSLQGPVFQTRANKLLKNLMIDIDAKSKTLNSLDEKLRGQNNADSNLTGEFREREEQSLRYKNFLTAFIDTVSDPVVAIFAIGFTRNIEPEKLAKPVAGLAKRFPQHSGINTIVSQYNELITGIKEPVRRPPAMPALGLQAPDFTMPDTDGNPFALSSLKGKFVLIDFWASWCGPCRRENPNVLNAYNKYKNNNFTVLGVSLDEDKGDWLKAIKDDGLVWKHVSDLKKWNSASVGLYGFEGIPYNVLIDPAGKILATELRGTDLDEKLSQVLHIVK